jgi:serine/threonine protein kinase
MSKLPKEFTTAFDVYKAEKQLGEGGTGRVLLVRNSAGDAFALKCLLAERVNSERRSRFKNEITFCLRSTHPNVLRVVDTGVATVNGFACPFYVMPAYSQTFRDVIASKIDPDEKLRIFGQLLDGVEAAHLLSVWHRDLKPENVLYDPNNRVAVIADFGIARFTDFEHATIVETKFGTKLANLAYSAPEQRQKGAHVDQRADIFALGLMLNELFTGQIIQGTDFRTVGSVVPDFAWLDDVIAGMVKNDYKARTPSIDQVKQELIARGKEFAAQQVLDAKSRAVVRKYEPGEVRPVVIQDVDIDNGVLTLKLNRDPESEWLQNFWAQKDGYNGVMSGYGPEAYQFTGNVCRIQRVRDEQTAQAVIDKFKDFAASAKRHTEHDLRRRAEREEQNARAELQRAKEEAERRLKILKGIKL